MTPILRNRHEKVQEASINLIGRIGEYQSIMSFHRSSDLFFLPADHVADTRLRCQFNIPQHLV
jgi:hypothetical protein